MNIRTSLTLTFFAIVAVMLSIVSLSIYFFSEEYREEDFYTRLRNKAENTAKLLIEVDEVSTELLKRIEKDNPVNLPNENIRIFNYRNEELYHSNDEQAVPVNTDLLDRIRLESEVRFRHGDHEVLGFLFAYQLDRFTVVASATDIYGSNKIDNLKNILVTVFLISLVLISVAGWVYAGRMLKPISKLVKEVDKISGSSLDLRLKVAMGGQDELAKLAETFNRMLERLEDAFHTQKQFIANASHELRTPLTAIAGEIEVALLQPRTHEEYVAVLKSLLEDTRNLGTLSSQLLLLAQTSSLHHPAIFVRSRIDEILWEAKEHLVRANPGYDVKIQFDLSLSDEAMIMECDPHLVRIVFVNLMDNGCKYSTDQTVMVNLRSDEGTIVVDFENRGAKLREDEIGKIFDPFIRGKDIGNIKGFGIGLSLASQIMKLHHGHIKVQTWPPDGIRFSVSFSTQAVRNLNPILITP